MQKYIAILSCFLLGTAAYADSTKDVNIVNTPTVNANIISPNPITVTGTVDVGSPLEAIVTGPVDVSGSTVTVDNTGAIQVTDVDRPSTSEIIQLGAGSGGSTVCLTNGRQFFKMSGLLVINNFPFVIPADKTLIISSISLDIDGSAPGQTVPFKVARYKGSLLGHTAYRSRVLTDVNGAGAGDVSISPGFRSNYDLCFFPPPAGTSSVILYGYLIDR